MTLNISQETMAKAVANARAQGLDVDGYLRRLMTYDEEQRDSAAAVEEGIQEAEAGRVRPAREALAQLGVKLG